MSATRKEITVENILQTLLAITEKKPFHSLEFLDDTKRVLDCINDMTMKESSKKSHLGRIMSVLKSGAAYDIYKKEFDKVQEVLEAIANTHEKSEAEQEKLVSWERVLEVREELEKQMESIDLTSITPKQYETMQTHMLLMLYTEMPPRRNDYANMDYVRSKEYTVYDTTNYYVVDTKEFIFNNYKTRATYGVQTIKVPQHVSECIERVVGMRMGEGNGIPFLINQNNTRINSVSTITRMLSKAFGSRMGCSALRHIYIMKEFPTLLEDEEKRKRIAREMAHSVAEQLLYIKR